jgi:hypothetical protein
MSNDINGFAQDYTTTSTDMSGSYSKVASGVIHLDDNDFEEDEMVNNPSHYQSMDGNLNIDCITAMQAAFGKYETAVFCKLNAMKYLWRASSKGGNQDIEKAQWYLAKYKELGGEDQ